MNSEQLRQQLAELRAQIEALLPANAAEQYLAQIFADSKFAPHLPAIIARLCSETPVYSFDVEADPDEARHPAHYTALWYDRRQPPIVIQYTRYWREMPQDRDDAPDAPEVAADMVDDPPVPLALSESAQTNAQGHSKQSATPASSDEPVTTPHAPTATPATTATAEEIAAERARIEARIAELEQQMEMHQAGPTPPRRVVRPSSSAAAAAPARGASEWRGRMF